MNKPVCVVDQMMGGGKTTAMGKRMNAHPEMRWMFATQYITECERIRQMCPALNFQIPNDDDTTKSADVLRLIISGENIALSHSLLSRFTTEMLDALHDQHYNLVMDEVFDVMHTVNVSEADKQLLEDSGSIKGDELTGSMQWTRENYHQDSKFYELKQRMDLGGVVESGDKRMMEWMYRPDMFEVFDEVFLLTYLFEWSPMRFYFDIVGIPFFYSGVRRDGRGEYVLCRADEADRPRMNFRNMIHIIDSKKRNDIGNDYYALSKSWYEKALKSNKNNIKRLRDNMRNVKETDWGAVRSSDVMWSTFSGDIKPKVLRSYEKDKRRRYWINGTFVEFSCRAKNEFGHKHHLAYLVNVFLPSALSVMLANHGVKPTKEITDGYATSVMIQWIWRSAIRNGEEIWLYMPSRRMRDLLNKWLDEVDGKGN